MRRIRSKPVFIFLLLIGAVGLLALAVLLFYIRSEARTDRMRRIGTWFANPRAYPEWSVDGGSRCGDAPMLIPTSGFIGVGWNDGLRPLYQHTGYDIFSGAGAENVEPVYAAYDGFLTREAGWRSAVIIRHPDFPRFADATGTVHGGQELWTYYTHMASADGETSYVDERFPRGTREQFVEAGTLLGYQGTWSGNAANPTGLHLHFSITGSTAGGGYQNETVIDNTFDPAPFLGLETNHDGLILCQQ